MQTRVWRAFYAPGGYVVVRSNGRLGSESAVDLAAEERRHGVVGGNGHGQLFATGPRGVLVLTPEGRHLGTILPERSTSNCTFGGAGNTLYITADHVAAKEGAVNLSSYRYEE